MLTIRQSWEGSPDSSFSGAALVRMAAMPMVSVATLALACLALDEPFDGAYLILALLAFSLTFPGQLPAPAASRLTALADMAMHWLFAVILLLALGWLTRTLDHFSEGVILAWAVSTPLATAMLLLVAPAVFSRLRAAAGVQRVAIIAGGGELACRLVERIEGSASLGTRVAGFFDDRAAARLQGNEPSRRLGGLDELAAYAKQSHVDFIYITLPMTSQPRIIRLLDELRDTTASIYFVPDIFLFDLIQARIDTIGGMPIVAVCDTPFYGVDGHVKRASDLVLATLILILIAPLMLAIAAAIKLTSPGPVLFKQRRYGLDGREIVVYKFRSMTVCEDGDTIRQATRDDARVTRLGAFLRASSLDELPQFINVLQGRMSVVGPRPHAIAHNEMYRKLINGYMIRHKVRPGITGLAQVNGARGETATLDRMQARIDYDLAYLRNWSLGLDLQIILKTLLVVWQKQNAY